MKKYTKQIAIVLFLVLAQLGAFSLMAHSQITARFDSTMNGKYQIIADETTICEMKNECKIETDNDKIFVKLLTKYQDIFRRYTCAWKTDRHGMYKHYTIYLSKEHAAIIIEWAKTNL